MSIEIVEVLSKGQEKDFIMLPWKIYKDDKNWVPPLISDFKKSIHGENNTLKQSGPYTMYLAYKNGEAVGRILVGINEILNKAKNMKEGYISLFESVDDYAVAEALFDKAYEYFRERGIERIIGPLTLPDGDDARGLLIDNFDDPPAVMNLYNPPYYKNFFDKYGFYKYWDVYAYYADISKLYNEKTRDLVNFAQEKFHFRVDKLDLKNIDRDMADVKKILEIAMPKDWQDFIPPNDEEIKIIAKNLLPVAVEDFIYIARTDDGEPIAFNIALPDYNQILKHLNGRLFPFGIFKYLYYRKKIDRVRLFVLFVVPKYRKKGVAASLYIKGMEAAKEHGIRYAEGSTIWEYNKIMQRDVESVGGTIYKTFRIFKKDIVENISIKEQEDVVNN